MAYEDNSFLIWFSWERKNSCIKAWVSLQHPAHTEKVKQCLRFDLALADSRDSCKHSNNTMKDPSLIMLVYVMTIWRPCLCASKQLHHRFSSLGLFLFVFHYTAKSPPNAFQELQIQSSGLTLWPPKQRSEYENIPYQGGSVASLDSLKDKTKQRQCCIGIMALLG